MTTNNDTNWNDRLQAIMPDNFLDNTSSSFVAKAGFLENMINRIGRTIILGQNNVNNPFSSWTKPVLDYGDTIQKYCLPYVKGNKPDYDPANPNPYKTVKTTPEVQYVSFNSDIQYKTTIFNVQLQYAFTNSETFGSFVSEIMNMMYYSAGLDSYLNWIKYLSTTDYVNTSGSSITTVDYNAEDVASYGQDIYRKINSLVSQMKYPSTKFNASGMVSSSPVFDIVMTERAKRAVNEFLSGVYNINKLDIEGVNFIYVDSFNTVEGQTNPMDVVILSKGMCDYTPRSPESGALYNPENYYTNMWYKEAGAYSFDPFYGAAQIYTVE